MLVNTLSGRLMTLTIAFVMLAEVLIFVPSVARFRVDYLQARLERAQIASLALLANAQAEVTPELEQELLENAGVLNVVLRRDVVRELVLSSPMPAPIDKTFDLRPFQPLRLIWDSTLQLFDPKDRVLRVIGIPVKDAGIEIEVTLMSGPLRTAMYDYGRRIFFVSLMISVIAAVLLFLAVRRFVVRPITRVIENVKAYETAPEDARSIIRPEASVQELLEAERALQSMQTQLSGALRQKERLAQLGQAVAKISHDLRNILTTAQLLGDRIEMSQDPAVQRAAPKLVGSLARAVNLCETTLAYGRAEEPAPHIGKVKLADIVGDVVEGESLAAGEGVEFRTDLEEDLVIRADGEQIFRVLSNLVRNARQAIETSGKPGRISITATTEPEGWTIRVADTGPGLPEKAREHLFRPFQGGVRRGGTGLGLAIAAELIRGHGGSLILEASGAEGTVFSISLPKPAEVKSPLTGVAS